MTLKTEASSLSWSNLQMDREMPSIIFLRAYGSQQLYSPHQLMHCKVSLHHHHWQEFSPQVTQNRCFCPDCKQGSMRSKVTPARYRSKPGVIRSARDPGYRCSAVLKPDICEEVTRNISPTPLGDIRVPSDTWGLSTPPDAPILLLLLFWVLCIFALSTDSLKQTS